MTKKLIYDNEAKTKLAVWQDEWYFLENVPIEEYDNVWDAIYCEKTYNQPNMIKGQDIKKKTYKRN